MKRWYIVGIIIIAAVLRFHNLSHVPPSPSLDEVSIGYNAYSILHTGADEYGARLPILLRAYDDFRPALYVYLVIPFVWLLGVTVAAVRLPSVILSLVTIYLTYSIGRLIGKKYLSFSLLGELTALLLAISPWHIYISRLGHEANVGSTLVVLAVYFFLSAVIAREKNALLWSSVFFGLSVHGYQSEKIVTPLLLGIGGVLYWKDLWKQKRLAITAAIVFIALAVPAAIATLSPQGQMRFRATSAFSPNAPQMVEAHTLYAAAQAQSDWIGRILHGEVVTSIRIFAGNYVLHFSPGWLFLGSHREAFKVPDMGLLYPWESILILAGLWVVWKSHLPKQFVLFLLAWIVIAPIPASVTTQAPHAMRSYTLLPGVYLVEALGIWYLTKRLRGAGLRYAVLVIGMVIASSVSMFWRGYFVSFPKEQSDTFQYAMKGAVAYALLNSDKYKQIQFAHQGNLYQSYMFFLFYSKYDPVRYRAEGGTVSGGYDQSHRFGKYAFGYLPQISSQFSSETLYFFDAPFTPKGVKTIETFANLDGKPAIVAATL